MNNLHANTIWFKDGSSLTSAKDLVGTGGLSFQYTVNTQQITTFGNALSPVGEIRFNDNNAIDSTELYISTDTAVLNNQSGSSIDMKSFFFLQLRTSTIKTFVILYKKTDSSKKIVFSVSNINISNTRNHATFTLGREVAFSSSGDPFVDGDEVILSFKILGDAGPQGPPVSGGGVIPYEPYNKAISSVTEECTRRSVIYNQFQSPANGDYTKIQIYTQNQGDSGTSENDYDEWVGTIAVAIYSNTIELGPDNNGGFGIGRPDTIVASGSITFSSPTNIISRILDIELDGPVLLYSLISFIG